jgi:hypothetical protein
MATELIQPCEGTFHDPAPLPQPATVLGVAPCALLADTYAFSGNKMEAEKALNQLKELSKERYVSAYSFALVYLGLGNKEETLRWLEKGYEDRAGDDLPYLRGEPLLDPTARRSTVRRVCRKSFCAEECIVAMNLDARTT